MTQQDRQLKKVKLYRVLKAVFYCLGLPLFVMAVFLASIRFIGNDPFTGNTLLAQQLGMFYDVNKLFTSPALYGVWIALAIWIVIAIVHIILAKTVKSRRVRALSVTAFTMVVMLGCLFGMDAALGARVDKIAQEAPATVTVQDYKTLLSYYRTISSYAHKKNLTEKLIDQVEMLEKVYHVEWEGVDKTGVAGSIGNKPVTYYNIIADDGTEGIDISYKTVNGIGTLDYTGSNGNYTFKGDGNIDRKIEGDEVIRLLPGSDGILTINGKTYSHYFAQERTYPLNGNTYSIYTWYTRDMESTSWREGDDAAQAKYRENGVYGEGLYSQNGLLSDGWIFSFENVIEILEDYYEAKDAIENGNPTYYANAYAKIYEAAYKRRNNYYNNEADPWLKALYNQEVYMTERFSLTRGELDELIAKLGALLGDNSLFDYLFGYADDIMGGLEGDAVIGGLLENVPFLGGGLGNLFKQLSEGFPISSLLSALSVDTGIVSTIADVLSKLTGKTYDYVDDLILTLAYKTNDGYGVKHDNLYLAVSRGVGEWRYVEGGEALPLTRTGENSWVYTENDDEFVITENNGKKFDKDGAEIQFVISASIGEVGDIYLDIDFSDALIDEETGTYAFDFDTLSAFLNKGLNNLLEAYVPQSTFDTILNLVKTINILKTIEVNGENYIGLSVLGIDIPIINSQGKVDIDINGILTNLLSSLYAYQSSVIKPVWEFYTDESYSNKTLPGYVAQWNYARYERALYTATVYGSMIGSTLIGDSLGTGAYASSLGLTDLASVQQLKTDLSYQREFFPLFAVRDMIALFAGVVILFYFISFIAAQREEDYATGKLTVRARKSDKATKKHEAEIIAEFDENGDKVGEAPASAEEAPTEENNPDEAPTAEDVAVDAESKPEESATDEAAEEGEPKTDEEAENSAADEVKGEEGAENTAADETTPDENAEEVKTEEPVVDEPKTEESANEEPVVSSEEPSAQEEPAPPQEEPAAQEEEKGEAPDVPVNEESDEEVL